ncbi:MAG: ribonuclease III, partial [Victivallaceae bacterium]|nr:ribonuclease III [Victivallaceae bacterium]
MANLGRLREKLGFRSETPAYLAEALTHRSYAVEHGTRCDNQRLEFLGDAVLEIVLSEYLFSLYPDAPEGELTKMRSALARESTLAQIAAEMELGSFLKVGRGEAESGGERRASTLADLFEAVLGALYLDAGFDAARRFIL